MVLCNVPFGPKGPNKYIVPTMLNMFLLGPLSTRSHRTSKSCPLDLLGIVVFLLFLRSFAVAVVVILRVSCGSCCSCCSCGSCCSCWFVVVVVVPVAVAVGEPEI